MSKVSGKTMQKDRIMALPDIHCKVIPHVEHRYPTVGDYTVDVFGARHYRVSDMRNPDYEFMVLIHEMIEHHLCARRGITPEDVDAFDLEFEKERQQRLHEQDDEPGDDPRAPYYHEHQFAIRIEVEICRYLGLDWAAYNKVLGEIDL